ncbi:hypothetical protein LUZ60_005291 [Juncus effusus]|nr:hypothetical protein LUZ60_005291 [Juncus effusus]
MLKFLKRSQIQETILRADLIKQKEAVQQAERKSMNKSMAFAQASHDVRNQLLNVIGLINKCLTEVAPESDMAKDLKDMESCADNLQGILKSILDTSKVESGKMHLQVSEFDISKTIEESVDLSNVRAHDKGLEIIWDPCDFSVVKLGKVQGDKIRFKQVLDNLLGNAVNYTDEGQIILRAWAKKPNLKFSSISSDYGFSFSRVFCCLSRPRNEINPQKINSMQNDPFAVELIFEVDDTGIGIPVEKRASVFENYVQVKEGSLFMNKDNVDKPQGTGLGLGIVQSFVRLMGGEISIQDKEPGKKGTCFKFNIFLRSSGFHDMKDQRSEFTSEFPVFNEPNMVKGVHSLLFVGGYETKNILTRWMESLGIKVWIAQEIEQISPTLEKIKHNINSSSKSDSILFCKTFSRNSSSQEKEGFLSVGRERMVDLAQRKAFYGGLPLRVLIIVDISKGNLSEIWLSLRDFITNNPYISCKVACISDLTTSSQAKHKFKSLPNCDLVLEKPVHGSKLQSLFELIKELERMGEGDLKTELNQPLDENKDENRSVKQNEIVPEIKIKIEDEKPLRGMTILYAEDDRIARKIGTRTLVDLGATVELAENGLIALDLVKQALKTGIIREEGGSCSITYNVILMDCQMPLMDGYEATREIRKKEKHYDVHVPIIALTGNTGEEEQRKSSQAGMDFHMPKPLERNRLLEAIRCSIRN